jgi:plasmid stabilization system protein ParE
MEAVEWYNSQRPGLGLEFEQALAAAIELIKDNPLQFPIRQHGTRAAALKRFPYALRFVPKQGAVLIFACLHMSRDPRLWRNRARVERES